MTIKAVLFDVDWVIITNVYSFSKQMQKYYLNNKDDMLEFFNGEFRKTSIWKADLKEILKPRLEKWNWILWVENFLDLWFLSEAKTDIKILNLIKILREKNILCCVTTNQEKYRKEFLLEELWFNNIFDKQYFSCDLKQAKPSLEYFQKIIDDLKLKPEEILFIDDDQNNVKGAKNLWIEGIYYKNFSDIEKNSFLLKYL